MPKKTKTPVVDPATEGITTGQVKISPWHSLKLARVLKDLKTDPDVGLTEEDVLERVQAWGKNELPKGKRLSTLQMLGRQFTSPLVYILLVAAILTAVIKEYSDTVIILVVVAANALIGLFQEYRANKIFEKLKEIVRVQAIVTRGGKIHTLDSSQLVPGDVIILRGGDKVPADARLVEASNLKANEALLTGESKATKKSLGKFDAKAQIGDRSNMVFMGTLIEQGEGRAVVVSIGARTEIGQISALTQNTEDEQSPLQQRMGKLGTFLTEIFVVISLAIFLIGLVQGDSVIEMIKTTIAIAVAAIPEGLPAAISIILAVSSQKILKRKGLVRKLIAAETLGSTSVISTDKTGTLTLGQMKVEQLLCEDKNRCLLALAFANEAVLEEKNGKIQVTGESTDKAKLEAFLSAGNDFQKTLNALPRLAILPFDDSRKYIASFHKDKDALRIFQTGAPEMVLKNCRIEARQQSQIQQSYEDLAKRGFRLIAVAEKRLALPALKEWTTETMVPMISSMDYLGLAAIRDPIREDVRSAMQLTRQAGIKILMVTGDHILTAKAIGLELGFATSNDAVINGEELDTLSDDQLKKRVGKLEIIARVNPVHKMRIINAWQKLGAVVAMTGDGVNDAPSLKSADIGIAIGSGTDVAKEASDLILLNDSFSTITAAVSEGRTGFANIRKATTIVMSNAFTEITLITCALIFSTPFLPIIAVQILWVNIVEDGLPVLSLAFEPSEEEIMKSKPTSPEEPILNREVKYIIFAVGILADLTLFGIFYYLYRNSGWDAIKIQSFVFVATAAPTLLNIFALKSLKTPIHRIKLLNNHFLLMAVGVGFALMFMAIYVPFFNQFLKTVPLPIWPALASFLLFPLFKLTLVELVKWQFRR